ncbi:MAG: hypothetical protein HIU81_09860 [Acidobacteria bacterium]|nr:hypothetical protein [Acidobacteriota bacterium]
MSFSIYELDADSLRRRTAAKGLRMSTWDSSNLVIAVTANVEAICASASREICASAIGAFSVE